MHYEKENLMGPNARLRSSLFVAPLFVLFSGASSSQPFLVEDLSILTGLGEANPVSFQDDFEDGTLNPQYVVVCGEVVPGDEADGALALQRFGTDPCDRLQVVVAPSLALTGDCNDAGPHSVVEATYRFVDPEAGDSYGILVSSPSDPTGLLPLDQFGLFVTRVVFAGVEFPDLLGFVTFDETFLGQNILSAVVRPNLAYGTVRFRIELHRSCSDPDELEPRAFFELDSNGLVAMPASTPSGLSAIAVLGAGIQATEGRGCSDLVDNDNDGLIDFGSDPGCDSIEDDTESSGDSDGDGTADEVDNCLEVANPGQEDKNAGFDDDTSLPGVQHYGDACDFDLNDDGAVGPSDFFGVLRPCLGSTVQSQPECDIADIDGDGVVGPSDFFGGLRPALGESPGPGVTEP